MPIPAPRSRGILERLRDPLWLPLVCALAAYLGWQAHMEIGTRSVVVPRRTLAAGTHLSARLTKVVGWSGPLPGTPLASPQGTLRTAAPAGLPLLADEVGGPVAKPPPRDPTVSLPASALLSAPPVAPGTRVALYAAASGTPPELVCPAATVAQGATQQALLVEVPPASLPAVLDAIAAGRLIVVSHPS